MSKSGAKVKIGSSAMKTLNIPRLDINITSKVARGNALVGVDMGESSAVEAEDSDIHGYHALLP
jgi:hypothetical protein